MTLGKTLEEKIQNVIEREAFSENCTSGHETEAQMEALEIAANNISVAVKYKTRLAVGELRKELDNLSKQALEKKELNKGKELDIYWTGFYNALKYAEQSIDDKIGFKPVEPKGETAEPPATRGCDEVFGFSEEAKK